MARVKDKKPKDTRGAIIRAAYDLFLKQGYHGTSMRAIASRAGFTVAAAYNHFANKERLYEEVLREHQIYAYILPALEQTEGESLEDFLAGAARLILQALDREPGFLNLVFIEIVEFKSKHMPALFRKILPRLTGILQRIAERESRLRPIPLPVLIRSFVGLFFSYRISELLIWKYLPAEMRSDYLDDFIDIYLHGVVEPAPAAME
jgi:AcrR family transcriptional regulator